ncbi:Uncharacterised protein [Chromobacterium violaceum]|uniref:Uncharacterized protein n=1 Tax=Chromobacterium violaceum TaxID=536 RepID=A0A3S4HPA0_CHRVL|nr:Uncharacterised protein [Chromobacterium violaceum]
MNAIAIEPQTNLYTRLMEAAVGRYRAELDAVNGQLRNIERAERMARRLRDIELDASAQAGPASCPTSCCACPSTCCRCSATW